MKMIRYAFLLVSLIMSGVCVAIKVDKVDKVGKDQGYLTLMAEIRGIDDNEDATDTSPLVDQDVRQKLNQFKVLSKKIQQMDMQAAHEADRQRIKLEDKDQRIAKGLDMKARHLAKRDFKRLQDRRMLEVIMLEQREAATEKRDKKIWGNSSLMPIPVPAQIRY